MDPILTISYQTIADFLEAAEGNYRNAIYVSCHCHAKEEAGCRDFLFIPSYECRPIIFPLKDARIFLGTPIEPSECAGQLTSHQFLHLYNKWIELTLSSSSRCPIQQLLCIMNHTEIGK